MPLAIELCTPLLNSQIHIFLFSKPVVEDHLFLDLIHILCTFWLIWQQFALSIFPWVDLKQWFWIYISQMAYHFVKIYFGSQDFIFRLYLTKNTLSSANSISVWLNWLMPKQQEKVSQAKIVYKNNMCLHAKDLTLWFFILWPQNCSAFLTKSMGMEQKKEINISVRVLPNNWKNVCWMLRPI